MCIHIKSDRCTRISLSADIKYHSYREDEVSQNVEYHVGSQNPVDPFREFGLIQSNRKENCDYCERNFNASVNPFSVTRNKARTILKEKKQEELTATNLCRISNKPMRPIKKRSSRCSWVRSSRCHKRLNKS